MSNDRIQKSSPIYIFHCVIFFLLTFGFGYLPAIEPITPLGMKTLGIFLGLLYGWSFVDMFWTSLIGLLATGLTGAMTVNTAISVGFGSNITQMVLFCAVFSAYLSTVGFTEYLAYWFISRKFAVGRPYVFIFLILFAAFILGACISVIATLMIVWSIFYGICDILGYKKGDKFTSIIMVGISYFAALGGGIFPWKPLAAVVYGYMIPFGYEAGFVSFTIACVAVSIGCFALFMFAVKFIIRPDVTFYMQAGDSFAEHREKKMNKAQKIGAFCLIAYIAMLFLPEIMPVGMTGRATLKNLGMAGCVMLILAILVMIKPNGESLLNFKQAANQGINWDVIVLVASSLPVASILGSAEAGVMTLVGNVFGNIVANVNHIAFAVIVVLLASAVTQIAHNLVCAAVFTPIMCTFAAQIDISPMIIAPMLILALTVAIATPGASTTGAPIFGNSTWCPIKDAYLYNFYGWIITMICMVTIGLPITALFF